MMTLRLVWEAATGASRLMRTKARSERRATAPAAILVNNETSVFRNSDSTRRMGEKSRLPLVAMYTIHHEADTALFERRHLESSAYSRSPAKNDHLRAGASSGPGEVREFVRRPQTGHAGDGRVVERPER